ncbi:MAG: CDGSH iron-sulfur domain-containing protein [Planctomycetota bacterium]|nr:CDGSH iron-sulfur domain-containing protein [Planctomycetota bacterium]
MHDEPPGKRQNRPFVTLCEPGKYAYCTCRQSKRYPFCDGTHREYSDGEGKVYSPIKVLLDEERRVAWCACGASGKMPYCDGSHADL